MHQTKAEHLHPCVHLHFLRYILCRYMGGSTRGEYKGGV